MALPNGTSPISAAIVAVIVRTDSNGDKVITAALPVTIITYRFANHASDA
jgi:hypothetical protein